MHIQRNLTDFIQKNRSHVRQFEDSRFSFIQSSGKGAFDVAEQFAFQDAGRKGGAIDRHKGGMTPSGSIVDTLGEQLLAGPGAASDHNRTVHGCIFECQAFSRLNGRTRADNIVEGIFREMFLRDQPTHFMFNVLDLRLPLHCRHRADNPPIQFDRFNAENQRLLLNGDQCATDGFAALNHIREKSLFDYAIDRLAAAQRIQELLGATVQIGDDSVLINTDNPFRYAVHDRPNKLVAALQFQVSAQPFLLDP